MHSVLAGAIRVDEAAGAGQLRLACSAVADLNLGQRSFAFPMANTLPSRMSFVGAQLHRAVVALQQPDGEGGQP
jgi:hypothetical protein